MTFSTLKSQSGTGMGQVTMILVLLVLIRECGEFISVASDWLNQYLSTHHTIASKYFIYVQLK